jgi:hypothetical protein
VPFAVVIQPDCDEVLNAARQHYVIEYLLQCGIADAAARVVVGLPEAEGLFGDEAPGIAAQILGGRAGTMSTGPSGLFSGGRAGFFGGFGGMGTFGGGFLRGY